MKTNVLKSLVLRSPYLLVPVALMVSHAAAPTWWMSRSVIVPNAQPEDYAAINQGQLKNLVAGAVAEMNAKLQGGAGLSLNQLVNSWGATSEQADDYTAVNIGQLREVSRLVYTRLFSAGVISAMPPWTGTSESGEDNFALANIGQAKNLFAFDVPDQVGGGTGTPGPGGWWPPSDWNGDATADPGDSSASDPNLTSGLGESLLGLSFRSSVE